MGHHPRARRAVVIAAGCVFAVATALPAHAAATAGPRPISGPGTVRTAPGAVRRAPVSTLPTAAGVAACQRLGADRARLRSARAIQGRDARIPARTARQKARKAAVLRTDAARTAAATARLRADTAACDARWHWPYPNSPRLDQGLRPTCGLYAALQQLNIRGARISQSQADQLSDRVSPQAPSATRSTDDILRTALAGRGIRATYRRIPATADATLAAVQSGPVAVEVAFTTGMDATDGSGHWLVRGAPAGLHHAVVLVGYDPTTQHVLLLNQWGRWWGADGAMWLTRAEYARVLTGAAVWTQH